MSNTIAAPADELVFNIGASDAPTEVKEVRNLPRLSYVSEDDPILKSVLPAYDWGTESTEECQAFIEALVLTMRATGGIGLSASQVGSTRRVFVMDTIDMDKQQRKELLICFNPELIRELEPPSKANREGCLSFPGLALQIRRSTAIEVAYQNEKGEYVERELFGIDARCYLHELDHMNGVLFTSKVSPQILHWEREKQRKLLKKAKKQWARSQT